LDEAGFAPTLPTNYSWYPRGERLHIPYEAPQGRRVNAIGAYFSHGVLAGRLEFELYGALPESRAKKRRTTPEERAAAHGLRPEEVGTIDSERLIQFIWKVAGRPPIYPEAWERERPLEIWLDNYSVHKSERVRQEQPAWEKAGITLDYLPSYSPELSKIEPIWQDVKYRKLPQRSHDILGELKGAVAAGLTKKAAALLAQHHEPVQLLQRAA
jgi:putative transposase